MRKKWMAAYLAVTLFICLLPLAGLIWKRSGTSSENRRLADPPALKTDGKWNLNFLADAGTYFEDHFAYRTEMATADAWIKGKFLGTSSVDSVIQGTDGWLYYTDSLDDYLGESPLSDRAIFDIAHTLKLMQDYVEKNGRSFLFTVAPNKNTLYGEHMPYYDSVKISDLCNVERLEAALKEEGIHYADLFTLFDAQEETLYHERDSHWNNKGAAMAAELILDGAGKAHPDYVNAAYEIRTDFEGDLDKMLYPSAITKENEIYYKDVFSYDYTTEIESTFDPLINTVNESGEGGLLMYRDSFGNALLPFIAQPYAMARFSRGIPYYLEDMFYCGADTVIVERAERFLPNMAENPPVVQAPIVSMDLSEAYVDDSEIGKEEVPEEYQEPGNPEQDNQGQESQEVYNQGTDNQKVEGQITEDQGRYLATCNVSIEGLNIKFTGTIEKETVETDSRIYLRLDGEQVFEAYPMVVTVDGKKNDYGYVVYIAKDSMEEDLEQARVEVFVASSQGIKKVYDAEMEINVVI